jgi:hypothetical protein
MKVSIGKYRKNSERKIKVEITREDTWSLDYTLALVILPALQEYKKILQETGIIWGCAFEPDDWNLSDKKARKKADKNAIKKQNEILDKMILAFQLVIEDDCKYEKENQIKVEEGLALFAEYYGALWW